MEKINKNKINHQCRFDCGACCIAPSISSEIPGMKSGKPAGIRCIHLTVDFLCNIFDDPSRPLVCKGFGFDPVICGTSHSDAMEIMGTLEMKNDIP